MTLLSTSRAIPPSTSTLLVPSRPSLTSSPLYGRNLIVTPLRPSLIAAQGHVDKVVVVIKNAQEQPLERFIFAVRNTLEIESYNKDTRSFAMINA